ncbi:MAG: hypothetical protein QY332_08920 [Anaerolineales bacterium]|nr:MAG: hypothetical protein QY332_08920 [Anaerolineales bacterium]
MTKAGLIPIYTTKGDAEAFLSYPYLFNRNGEWIGFVTQKREVYSVLGDFVGTLTNDPRIVRKRATSTLKPRLKPPAQPPKIYPPATVPLPPMMADLSHSVIDVLLDTPERLHTIDSGEQRQDLD